MFKALQIEKLPSVEEVRDKGKALPQDTSQIYLMGVKDVIEAIKKDSRNILEDEGFIPVLAGINGYVARGEEELGYMLEAEKMIQSLSEEENFFTSSTVSDKDSRQERERFYVRIY